MLEAEELSKHIHWPQGENNGDFAFSTQFNSRKVGVECVGSTKVTDPVSRTSKFSRKSKFSRNCTLEYSHKV